MPQITPHPPCPNCGGNVYHWSREIDGEQQLLVTCTCCNRTFPRVAVEPQPALTGIDLYPGSAPPFGHSRIQEPLYAEVERLRAANKDQVAEIGRLMAHIDELRNQLEASDVARSLTATALERVVSVLTDALNVVKL